MSSQDNNESVDKEAGSESENKLYVVYNAYICSKLEDLPRRVSQARFREIYRQLWKKDSKTCEKIYKVLINMVTKNSLEEIEDFNESFSIKDKLKTINEISSEYSNSEDVIKWRPNGNVEEALISHDVEEMLKRKHLLEKTVKEQKRDIEKLQHQLDKNSAIVREAAEKTEEAVKDLEQKLSDEVKCHKILASNLRKI